eukprot:2613714-Lingulodinium_polyedra.AAC.1
MVAHFEGLLDEVQEQDETWQLDHLQLVALGSDVGCARLDEELLSSLPGLEGPIWTLAEAQGKIRLVAGTVMARLLGTRAERRVGG